MKILGVRIDELSQKQILARLTAFLAGSAPAAIFTPNPEMLVKAQQDQYFKTVLHQADLTLCDGFGLWLVAAWQGRRGPRPERFSGVDCLLALCSLAEIRSERIFLLGSGSAEVVAGAAARLRQRFPRLIICGQHPGPVITESANGSLEVVDNKAVLQRIQAAEPTILVVAFGMGKQEKWIIENRRALPTVRIALGVGGALAYVSGTVRRAPRLLQRFGLEWAYRLIRQPWRVGRIFNATIRFCWLVIKEQRAKKFRKE